MALARRLALFAHIATLADVCFASAPVDGAAGCVAEGAGSQACARLEEPDVAELLQHLGAPTVPGRQTLLAGQQGVFRLNTIEVKGTRLYDSVTGDEFFGVGIGMPNTGDVVKDWIDVLTRIKALGPNINTVRVYELPACALATPYDRCFDVFFQEADKLGLYVLMPGTGRTWGFWPAVEKECWEVNSKGEQYPPATPNGCYRHGGLLGFGQEIVSRFNFPNVLAIVIGNEFDQQMSKYMPALKGYIRDLKLFMKMCHENDASPTKGYMRSIPLMYASSDAYGDAADALKAQYLFCGDKEHSVDIFGLNVERWCDDTGGKIAYDGIRKWVEEGNFPGAFMFSEMGCHTLAGPRSWHQVHDFFTNFPSFSGFWAYTYNGNKDFDMFDKPNAKGNIEVDGTNFFNSLKKIGDMTSRDPGATVAYPSCPPEILGHTLSDYNDVEWYDTGAAGWAQSCPEP